MGGVFAPLQAMAHAFGARYDLPLPLSYYLGAAGLAVCVSFLGVFLFLRRTSTATIGVDIPFPQGVVRSAKASLRAVGLLVLVTILTTAILGPDQATDNFATVMVWVWWWVGFLLLSALVIPLWPYLDPFRGLYRIGCMAVGRDPEAAIWRLPTASGWLAPIGLFFVAWVELVSDWSESPAALAVMVGLYGSVSLLGAAVFGMAWFRIADPLGRVFRLLGRVAPIVPTETGALRLRPPGEGLVDPGPPEAGEILLVVCLIGMVLFDGLSETPAWATILDFVSGSEALRPSLLALRDHGVNLLKLVRTVGLVGTILAFFLSYLLLAWTMQLLASVELTYRTIAVSMAGTLLPIAAAYHLSHYISYLLLAGQLIGPTASDPFGVGWNLFGMRESTIDVGLIGAEQVWWIALIALICGHSLSVVVGHRHAVVIFGAAGPAARSQLPMIVAMVGLTVLSLWILSQPLVAR